MTNFDKAFQFTMGNEGGFSDRPADRGGPTKYGITLLTLNAHTGKWPSVRDIAELTEAKAKEIYLEKYWGPMNLDAIKSAAVATLIFDQAVNRGVSATMQVIQKIMLADRWNQVIQRINGVKQNWLALEIVKQAQDHYVNVVLADTTQLVFLRGWINRTQRMMEILLPPDPEPTPEPL